MVPSSRCSIRKQQLRCDTCFNCNGVKLTPGKDYSPNIEYYIGKAKINPDELERYDKEDITVVVTGLGYYEGSKGNGTYRIAGLSMKDARVRLKDDDSGVLYKEYTGKPVEFTKDEIVVSVRRSGGTFDDLSDKEYEIVGYRNNDRVGTGVMILRGKWNHCGTVEIKFKITKKIAG